MTAESTYVPALRFRALTRFYDTAIGWTMREREFRARLVAQVAPRAGERILDLGCGSGTLALRLHERAPGAEIVGVDGDAEILAQARAKAAPAGPRFDLGLAGELPYADGSFAKVVSSLVFHHLAPDDKLLALREVHRVLRPGGELHVADWGRPANALASVLFFITQLFDGFTNTRLHRAGGLPALFATAGFAAIEERESLATMFGTLAFHSARRTLAVRSTSAAVESVSANEVPNSTTKGAGK